MKLNVWKKLTAALAGAGSLCACSAMTVLAASETAGAGGAEEATPSAAPSGGGGGSSMSWIILIVYILIFVLIGYFLIFRPNKKRKQEEEKLRQSLMLGDTVTTIGGICGTIVNIKDDVITIETSIDRTLVEFKNWAIREVKKPISDDDGKDSKDGKKE